MNKQLVRRIVPFLLVVVVAPLAACSDDKDQGAKACDAAIELQQSLDTLLSLDPDSGIETLRPAVAQVRDDFDNLVDTAKDSFHDQLDALGKQLDELRDAVAGDGDVADELSDVDEAWGDLVSAVHAAASQCDVSARIGA